MPNSNYPNGFNNGVTIRGIPILNTYGGNVIWVSSGSGLRGDGTFTRPYTDLDTAVGNCTADNGDIIMVKAGHAESLTADSAVDIDVAGVSVVGLGTGEDRPTFTFTTAATADFKLAAANVTVQNLLFKAGIDALTGPIEVSADDCAIVDCEYRDDDANNYETTDVVVTTNTPLRMLIDGFRFIHDGGSGGTQNQSVIQLNGADHAIIRNCWLVADSGTGVIEDATVSDQILIDNCMIENTETSPTVAVFLQATTTGTIRDTNLRVASGTTYLTATNDMQLFESFGTGTDATSGEKIGTVLSGDVEGKIDVIDGYHDVPTADVATNSQMRDVIGNKTDAAATGAVSAVESIMAYAKQLVTEGIARDTAIGVVDGYHDVPSADTTDNAQARDVVGNKTDAAATGAVSAVESIMAYAKQLVTEGIARDTAIGVIDGFHDVPTADTTNNAQARDVIGNKTDAAAAGAVSAVESLMAYLKQVVTQIGTDADTDALSAALYGGAGIASYPAAAAPGDGISVAEALRYISENQAPRFATKSTGDLTSFGTSKNLFTVTGDVLVKVGGSVDVAVTSTSGTTTLEVGVAGNTACLCVQDAVDNTAFDIGDSWSLDTAADANGAQLSSEWVLVGNGVDIILTGSVDDITAGDIDFYCQWMPLSSDGAIAAA